MSGPGETCTVTRRSIVTDASGNLWDMANPIILGIESATGGTSTTLLTIGSGITISVSFSVASAAFNAT